MTQKSYFWVYIQNNSKQDFREIFVFSSSLGYYSQ